MQSHRKYWEKLKNRSKQMKTRGKHLLSTALVTSALGLPWSAAQAATSLYADFNCDGHSDLAIGVPEEALTYGLITLHDAGAVNVLYGSPNGLTFLFDQIWHQDVTGMPDSAEAFDHFGVALTSGDFNGDGCTDLAVGVAGDDAVHVLRGSPSGLTTTGTQFWTANTPGVQANGDGFGLALAAADFNKDNRDDLAIGVPCETVNTHVCAGAVQVLYSSANGLTASGAAFFRQGVGQIEGGAESGDSFGETLATGDFDKNGYADLAVGVPFEDVGADAFAGAVNVIYGQSGGLNSANNQIWHQDSPSIPGEAEEGDEFGQALATGDFNGDGYTDLAIGAPYEDVPTYHTNGAVHVLFGSAYRLTVNGTQLMHNQNGFIGGWHGGAGAAGSALAAGDFNGDGRADLAIGAPGAHADNGSSGWNEGQVNVLYGFPGVGFLPLTYQVLDQSNFTLSTDPSAGDRFGKALTVGDFNKNGRADLAVGVPGEDNDAVGGAVQVFYGTSSGITTIGAQLWSQDSPNVEGGGEDGDSFGAAVSGRR